MTATIENLEIIGKLSKDVREAGSVVTREEARELVDLYYRLQKDRIVLGNQSSALTKAGRPTTVVDFFMEQFGSLERQMVTVLDKFSMSSEVGEWSREQLGIGPVIAAGFLAHIDIEKAPTVGHIWRFAGLDPTVKWEKGQRRPWNADLKVLCWKAGESFKKVSGREDALYGQMYRQRKAYELERDARGGNAETAARTLEEKKIKDPATKATYESGHLPAGRLDLRATRWAVKLFLSHWHHVAFVEEYGENPPKPYILTQDGGHAHYIAPPGYQPR
jgi:hypothetical protein